MPNVRYVALVPHTIHFGVHECSNRIIKRLINKPAAPSVLGADDLIVRDYVAGELFPMLIDRGYLL